MPPPPDADCWAETAPPGFAKPDGGSTTARLEGVAPIPPGACPGRRDAAINIIEATRPICPPNLDVFALDPEIISIAPTEDYIHICSILDTCMYIIFLDAAARNFKSVRRRRKAQQ